MVDMLCKVMQPLLLKLAMSNMFLKKTFINVWQWGKSFGTKKMMVVSWESRELKLGRGRPSKLQGQENAFYHPCLPCLNPFIISHGWLRQHKVVPWRRKLLQCGSSVATELAITESSRKWPNKHQSRSGWFIYVRTEVGCLYKVQFHVNLWFWLGLYHIRYHS